MFITLRPKRLLIPLFLCAILFAALAITGKPGQSGGAVLSALEDAPPVADDDTAPPADAAPQKLARTLIIDPGHGGDDGGCVSGTLIEADVNLDVALRLRALLGLFGAVPLMTRDGENLDYPKSAGSTSARKAWDQKTRVQLINATPDALLISIHQNSFPNAGPHGAQVFYAKTKGSDELAALIQEELRIRLLPENRRVAAPIRETIFLMKNVKCTAVMVECGFLSNAGDNALLGTDAYRLKLAAVIACAYLKY